jgi:hypothetical protein
VTRRDWLWWLEVVGMCGWIVTFGVLWLFGWGVLHASKVINRCASAWCRALLYLLPTPGGREP